MKYFVTFLLFCQALLSYSQEARYDSLQNINKGNYTQLVGQTLYAPKGELVVRNLFWSNKSGKIYKPHPDWVLYPKYSIPDDVLNKHYLIEKIITKSTPLLKTRITETDEVVYINLDALLNYTTSPVMFVDGYIQKCKQLFLNRHLYMDKTKYMKSLPSSFNTKVPNLASFYCNNIRVTTTTSQNYGGLLLLSDRTTSSTPTEINIVDYLKSQISKSKADEMIRKREIELANKAREDSIHKAKEDSIARQKKLDYCKTHDYDIVPTDLGSLYCKYCERYIDLSENLICIGANNDSIIWMDKMKGNIGLYYTHLHKAEISKRLKEYDKFIYHYTAFEDSLNQGYKNSPNLVIEIFNSGKYLEYMKALEKAAPYGFVGKRSWSIDYRNLTLKMQYTNTNKKTIKYIEMFWQTKNDVGDVRNRGSFKGTGPVKQWDSGSWDWDNTSYYVARDVTSFWVTKMVITYMDGTKKVLTEKQIVYDSRE